ncbi:MAG: hypothetical protein AB1633_00725 [Elusimicrobiota bacterium]
MKFPFAQQVLRNKPGQVNRLVFRIKAAGLMDLKEQEFGKLVQEVESSDLFKKLRDYRAIKLQQFPHLKLPSHFYELNEATLPGKVPVEVETLLRGREELIRKIRALGLDKFRQLFLDDYSIPDTGIALQGGLGLEEVRQMKSLIEDMFIREEFNQNPVLQKRKIDGNYYTKVACILRENNEYIINYTGLSKYRLKYTIDYEKIKDLKKQKFFSKDDSKKLGEFLNNLELINERKQVLNNVIVNVIEYQKPYFESGEPLDLKPITQRQLGRRINVSPSHISRVIRYKCLETPRGEEKPLNFFLPNRKSIIKTYIREIMYNKDEIKSDADLKKKIEDKLKLSVSRRSVALYRSELEKEL